MPNRASELSWNEPQPAQPTGLTRAAVVSSAVRLADAKGLESVSIRRVAAALRARPMSLYTHIASKDSLLDLMVNEVVAEVIVGDPLPEDWREALQRIARQSHAAFVAHPWMLKASGPERALGPNAVRHAEQLLTAVAPLKLQPQKAWAIAGILNDYTLGHALRVAHASGVRAQRYPNFDPTTYPHLASALSSGGHERDQLTFEAGLQAVLDGIERRFAR